MHPLIENIKQNIFAVLDNNEIPHTFTGISEISNVDDQMDAFCKYNIADFDSSVLECRIVIRNKRGLADFLCGRNTKAAERYVRYSKRWKEKRRRERLKHKGECK